MRRARDDRRFALLFALLIGCGVLALRVAKDGPGLAAGIRIDRASAAAALANEAGQARSRPGVVDEVTPASEEREDQSEPLFDDPVLRRAESLRDAGQLTRAVVLLRTELEVGGENPAILSRLGSMLISAGDLAGAMAVLRRTIELDPTDARAHYNLGVALARDNRRGAALAAYEEAIRLQPGYFKALFNAGKSAATLGDVERAIAHYRTAAETVPPSKAAKVHFELGCLQDRLGLEREAIESYRRAIVLRPDYVEARNNLALALEDAGETDIAVAELEKAARLDPGRASIQYNLGRLYQEANRKVEAERCFARAVETEPTLLKARQRLAEVRVELGLVAEAVAEYEAVSRLDRDDVAAWEALSNLYRRLDNPAAAERSLLHWLELDPRLASTWNALGIVRARQDRYEEAIPAYDRAIALEPELTSPRFNRSLALEGASRDREAVKAYEELLELEPEHLGARGRLAKLLLRTGAETRAADQAAKLAKVGRTDPAALITAAFVLGRTSDPAAAVPPLRLALELDPENAQASFNLAVAYSRLELYEEAIPLYESVLRADPGHERATRYLERARARSADPSAAIRSATSRMR